MKQILFFFKKTPTIKQNGKPKRLHILIMPDFKPNKLITFAYEPEICLDIGQLNNFFCQNTYVIKENACVILE